eukprot:TRINITY_DN9680_c0_g1_i2.p1 TRINITY_DN9680_c0_g1~~TRINITY_DN9680_c0_g1_i2.p1  ORF type:complete len:762 (-),score=203.63 TRINITY_DN9680_c0_g1_i2:39-2324(-)
MCIRDSPSFGLDKDGLGSAPPTIKHRTPQLFLDSINLALEQADAFEREEHATAEETDLRKALARCQAEQDGWETRAKEMEATSEAAVAQTKQLMEDKEQLSSRLASLERSEGMWQLENAQLRQQQLAGEDGEDYACVKQSLGALNVRFEALMVEYRREQQRAIELSQTVDTLRDVKEKHAQMVLVRTVRGKFLRRRLKSICCLVRSTRGSAEMENLKTRNCVCREIVQSEEGYAKSLLVLLGFIRAVPCQMFEGAYLDEPARLAFLRASEAAAHMEQAHGQLLAAFKHVIRREAGEGGRLSVVFDQVTALVLSHYGEYVCRLPLLQSAFRVWFARCPEFSTIMADAARLSGAQLGIWAYLNLPIQRLVGYMQLLGRCTELTPQEHIDAAELQRAQQELQAAGSVVDGACRLYRNLVTMQRAVAGLPAELQGCTAGTSSPRRRCTGAALTMGVLCKGPLEIDGSCYFGFIVTLASEEVSLVLCGHSSEEEAVKKLPPLKEYACKTQRPLVFERVLRLTGGTFVDDGSPDGFIFEYVGAKAIKFKSPKPTRWKNACVKHGIRLRVVSAPEPWSRSWVPVGVSSKELVPLASREGNVVVAEVCNPLLEGVVDRFMVVTHVNGEDVTQEPLEAVVKMLQLRPVECRFLSADGAREATHLFECEHGPLKLRLMDRLKLLNDELMAISVQMLVLPRSKAKAKLRRAWSELDDSLAAAHSTKKEMMVRSLRSTISVSYTHLRAHETVLDLVCRLLLEKKKQKKRVKNK